MENVFVVPMDGAAAGERCGAARAAGRELASMLPRASDAALAEILRNAYPRGMCYVWGVRESPENRTLWAAVTEGDLILGYGDQSIVSASRVLAKASDPALAAALWDTEEPCGLLCFTDKPRVGEVPIIPQMYRYIDAEYGGFAAIPPEKVRNILSDYGSLEAFVSLCLSYDFPFSFRHSQD